MGVSALGSLSQAQGSIDTANAQAQQLKNQQAIAEYNAKVLESQAVAVGREGTAASNLQSRRSTQMISQQRAGQAQSNYFGQSADYILDQSAANAELDRLNMVYQTQSQVQGIKQQAAGTRYQGDIIGSQIQPTINAGYTGALGSLIGGAGQLAFLNSSQAVNPYINWGKM